MKRILIVEDDSELCCELKLLLENAGYEGVILQNFQRAKEEIISTCPDLILLDIGIPYMNGEMLLRELRKESQIPVIMVTSQNNETDEVLSMSFGADDYITKPFRANELLARLNCIMRRIEHNHDIIQTNDLSIDIRKYRVMKNNQEIVLSAIGYEILFLIVQNQGMVITRERMIEFIEEKTGNYIEDNTVSVHMKRLREKLGQYQQQEYIETVRGIGYRWKNI